MMQEIYKAIREEEQVHKTSDQLSHEDNKVAGTIAEKEILAWVDKKERNFWFLYSPNNR